MIKLSVWLQVAQLHRPVLTAIGLVNEPFIFDPHPTQSTSLNLSLKNLSQVITSKTYTAV